MKTKPSRFLASLSLLALGGTLLATTASARTRTHSGTFNHQVSSSPGERQANTTWTNSDGRAGSHQSTRLRDAATQSSTVSASTTHANGTTSGHEGTIQKTGDGTADVNGTYTRANGDTGTYSGTVTKTADGHATTGTITNASGQTATVNSTVTHADNTLTRDTNVTGPDGQTASAQVTTSVNGDTYTRTRTTTP